MYKGYEQIQKQKNKVNKHMKNEKKKKERGKPESPWGCKELYTI